MYRFHRLTFGLVILLAFGGCSSSRRDANSTAFQPTETKPNTFQPTETKPNTFQPTETKITQTKITQTKTVPYKPTLAQVNQAQRQLNAQVTEQEVRISLPADILFDFDKADIRPDAADALRQTLTVIRYYEQAPIRVEGHTDSKGSEEYNQELSERRARSVKEWLVSQGNVPTSRITTKGFGESRPRAQNTKPDGSDDPAGRQLNRRVEVIIQK